MRGLQHGVVLTVAGWQRGACGLGATARRGAESDAACDACLLPAYHHRCTAGLRAQREAATTDQLLSNPALPQDLLDGAPRIGMCGESRAAEAVPGNIRKAQHFVSFMERFIEYVKVGCSEQQPIAYGCQTRMSVSHFVNELPAAFLEDLRTTVLIERKPLRCMHPTATLPLTVADSVRSGWPRWCSRWRSATTLQPLDWLPASPRCSARMRRASA